MKYFLGFLVSIGLVVLVFILIFRGMTGNPEEKKQAPLSDYASTATVVRFTVGGPIVSEQQYQSYQITVGRDQTRIETRQGYQGNIIEAKTYDNNQQSYTNFLRAIDFAGFAKGDKKSPNKDERGTCADGNRYIIETLNGTSEIQRFWSTTCRGQGNFKGNSETIRKLFAVQIPTSDFNRMTGKLNL